MRHTICAVTFIASALFCVASNALGQWVVSSQYATCFGATDTKLFAASNHGALIVSTDAGNSWENIDTSLTGFFSASVAAGTMSGNGTNLFVAGEQASVLRTTDNGVTWSRSAEGLPVTGKAIGALFIKGSKLFAGTGYRNGGDGVYLSIDSGKSWRASGLSRQTVSAFGVSAGYLFAGTDSGIFRSSNEGVTWVQVNKGIQNPSTYGGVTSFAVIGKLLFAAQDDQLLYRTSDNGDNWTLLKIMGFRRLAVGGNILFECGLGSNGPYVSTDYGVSWTESHAGDRVDAIFIFRNYVFAGTANTGLWRRRLSEFMAVSSNALVENGLVLAQNCPNPCSARTVISFSTDRREFVDIRIVDMLGKQYAQVFCGEAEAGKHSYDWNVTSMPTGVYFFNVRTENGIGQMPMMVHH